MDRYTYTPNLLLNKRLTTPFSPSGRNPSLHPRIISHISRYTKEREREEERGREGKEERKGRRGGGGGGGVDGVKMYRVTAQCSWGAKVSWGAMRDKTEIIGSYAITHVCEKTNADTRRYPHTLTETYARQEKR